jgi:4-hydroxy-tetrahydrodipicolinate reductase
MIHVAVAGAAGRMGRMLIEAVTNETTLSLSGALGRSGSTCLGQDACAFLGRESAVPITDDLEHGLAGAQVLIDFTRPEATLDYLDACVKRGIAMVIGTTGLSPEHKQTIARAAEQIGIVYSPNMSIGINVVFKLLEVAAGALDENFDVEILEAHHRHKIDAPSGTALRMGEVVARARKSELQQLAVGDRKGAQGARESGSIGFAVTRAGDIVGDHTVLFAASGERIEITHRSSSRQIYAAGSLRAVHFLASAPAGLYDMQDVLKLR